MTYHKLRLLFAGLARYDGRLSVLTARSQGPDGTWTVVLPDHVRQTWMAVDGVEQFAAEEQGTGPLGSGERPLTELEAQPELEGARGGAMRETEREPRIRVLLVDDHAVVRAGLRLFLADQADLEVVGEADDGVSAVARAQELVPDVVLMDLRMPHLDGIEATRQICAALPQIAVVVLTTYTDTAHVGKAIAAGAIGFVSKDVPPPELAATIREAAHGVLHLAPVVQRMLLGLVSRTQAAIYAARHGVAPDRQALLRTSGPIL